MSKVNNTKELSQKGGRLPNGILEKVAKKFDVTKAHVWQVRDGRRNNIEILAAIANELEKQQSKKAELREKISKLC